MSGINRVKSLVFKNATPILIALLAVFVLIKMPVFFTISNLMSLGSQAAIWGLAAFWWCVSIRRPKACCWGCSAR